MTKASENRFSDRVENYIKYRPPYPDEILSDLKDYCQLGNVCAIADIGSGTGIFSEKLVEISQSVVGIEPNAPMREAAEELLQQEPNFKSVNGTSAATTLSNCSVDLITAAQAFHWFDKETTKVEFQRILKPPGWTAILWNERLTDTSRFLADYERLLIERGTDYQVVNHVNIDDKQLESFFSPFGFRQFIRPNHQIFDFDGLKGRLLSSSYAPNIGHPGYEPMMRDLQRIFEKHQLDGKVAFQYHTKMYVGCLLPSDAS